MYNSLKNIQDNLASVSSRFSDLITAEELIETLTTASNWCENFINDFGIALTSLAQGKLPPSMFPPDALGKALHQIEKVIPRGWTLTSSTKSGELWHFYKEAKVTTARTNNGLRQFIIFPITDTSATCDLYQVISVPIPIDVDLAQRLVPLPAYIAISENRQLFAELQTNEIGECIKPSPKLCRIYTALSHRLSKRTCIISILSRVALFGSKLY